MQSYTEIPSSQSLQSSLALLLNNDKTALSCSSGSAFPTSNLQVGMLCLRTDQNKLYQLKDATPTWVMIADLANPSALSLGNTGASDLNSITTSGFYRVESPSANGTGSYGQLIVVHGGSDTITQIYGDYATGTLYTRSGNPSNVGGAGSWTAWRKLWNDANDGAGSGLDADLLDGYQSGNGSGQIPISNGTACTNLNADLHDGYHAGNGSGQIPVSNGTVNSNLNADLLDGYHASSFVRTIQGVAPDASGNVSVDLASRLALSGGTMSGTIYSTANSHLVGQGSGATRGYIYSDGAGMGFLNNGGGWAARVNYGTNDWRVEGAGWFVGEVYAANGTRVARVNEALSNTGPATSHFDQGGNIAGSKRLMTRVDGYQWWVYDSTSRNCNCNCTCTCCFTAGTKVTMADGSVKAVENVLPGEVVRGVFGRENVVLDQIVCHIEPGHNTYVVNGEVRMTGEHLLWTGSSWAAVDLEFYSKWYADRKASGLDVGIDPVKVRQLQVGDRVFNDGALVVVESLETQAAKAEEDLFSFELTGDKTFVANGYGVESKTFTEGFAHV